MTPIEPLGKWIMILSRYHKQQIGRLLDPLGLGHGRYPLLLHICQKPGIRQDSLAELLYLNKSSVARGVMALERDGFLTRKVDSEDKRVLRLYPTEKACEAQERVAQAEYRLSQEMTASLDLEEQAQLFALLRKVGLSIVPSTTDVKQEGTA